MSDWTQYPIYFDAIKKKSLNTLPAWLYLTIIKMKPLRKPNRLFCFATIIKMKSLTRLDSPFDFFSLLLK